MGIKSVFLSLTLLSICMVSTALNVTYDSTSLLFDGQRKLVISGAIHYPRSTPEVYFHNLNLYHHCVFNAEFHSHVFRNILCQMWPGLIQRAKDGGLDTIETYIFWNHHEPQYRQVKIMFFSLCTCV